MFSGLLGYGLGSGDATAQPGDLRGDGGVTLPCGAEAASPPSTHGRASRGWRGSEAGRREGSGGGCPPFSDDGGHFCAGSGGGVPSLSAVWRLVLRSPRGLAFRTAVSLSSCCVFPLCLPAGFSLIPGLRGSPRVWAQPHPSCAVSAQAPYAVDAARSSRPVLFCLASCRGRCPCRSCRREGTWSASAAAWHTASS